MHDSDAQSVRRDDAAVDAVASAVLATCDVSTGPMARIDAKRFLRAVESRLRRQLGKHERLRILETYAPHVAAEWIESLRAKPVRSKSGIAPLSLLTKPFPCPGRCVFCPNDVRMPKSYLSMEPGAQRATRNAFDPFAQTWNRLLAFHRNGHPIDKIELIVMGGTFTAYPREYQLWFVKRTFDALNEFDPAAGPVDAPEFAHDFKDCEIAPTPHDSPVAQNSYDATVRDHLEKKHAGRLLADAERSTIEDLRASHATNERARARCVGLSIETRPDRIDAEEIAHLRRLGVTKVQLGYQSLDDSILARNRRGCDVAASRAATALLRRAGFKVQAHWMPNLLGATPASDREDFLRLFSDPDLRPDELKIYPCALIESAELMRHHESGAWQAYGHDELVDLLVHALTATPRYCRVSRVIRDIPSHDIVVGNKQSNLREVATREATRRGERIVDIRARQIARLVNQDEPIRFYALEYELNGGTEVFLEASTERDELLGFLRLHLPRNPETLAELTDLRGAALIREVHVYGQVVAIGLASDDADGFAQHRGIGRELIRRAETRAQEAAFSRIAVISAVGTRDYYRRLGYVDGDLYLVKHPLRGAPA